MKVSGFTILRNGVEFDYPFRESIESLLPLVDEMVVNIDRGTDTSFQELQKLQAKYPNKKWVIFESKWPFDDPEKRKGGKILSEQTNLALDQCTNDLCFYLQADEVLHEADYPLIQDGIAAMNANSAIDGLLFDYVHFYGSFDVIQSGRSAYRREVRLVRKSSGVRSVGDAQSFRKVATGSGQNSASSLCVEKLRVLYKGLKKSPRVLHYGWVRTPQAMREKTVFMDSLYHSNSTAENLATGDNYRYKRFWGLMPFLGTHPAVMQERVRTKNWHWDFSSSPFVFHWSDFKKIALDSFERVTGHRPFEYRSYRILR